MKQCHVIIIFFPQTLGTFVQEQPSTGSHGNHHFRTAAATTTSITQEPSLLHLERRRQATPAVHPHQKTKPDQKRNPLRCRSTQKREQVAPKIYTALNHLLHLFLAGKLTTSFLHQHHSLTCRKCKNRVSSPLQREHRTTHLEAWQSSNHKRCCRNNGGKNLNSGERESLYATCHPVIAQSKGQIWSSIQKLVKQSTLVKDW